MSSKQNNFNMSIITIIIVLACWLVFISYKIATTEIPKKVCEDKIETSHATIPCWMDSKLEGTDHTCDTSECVFNENYEIYLGEKLCVYRETTTICRWE